MLETCNDYTSNAKFDLGLPISIDLAMNYFEEDGAIINNRGELMTKITEKEGKWINEEFISLEFTEDGTLYMDDDYGMRFVNDYPLDGL